MGLPYNVIESISGRTCLAARMTSFVSICAIKVFTNYRKLLLLARQAVGTSGLMNP